MARRGPPGADCRNASTQASHLFQVPEGHSELLSRRGRQIHMAIPEAGEKLRQARVGGGERKTTPPPRPERDPIDAEHGALRANPVGGRREEDRGDLGRRVEPGGQNDGRKLSQGSSRPGGKKTQRIGAGAEGGVNLSPVQELGGGEVPGGVLGKAAGKAQSERVSRLPGKDLEGPGRGFPQYN